MRIEFTNRPTGPKNLLAEAEIHFEASDGFLRGTKLTGFTLWRTEKDQPTVTLPARSWGDGGERKFFDLLRAGDGGVEDLRACKQAIVDAWLRVVGHDMDDLAEGRGMDVRTRS